MPINKWSTVQPLLQKCPTITPKAEVIIGQENVKISA